MRPKGPFPVTASGACIGRHMTSWLQEKSPNVAASRTSVLVLGKDFLTDFQHHLSRAFYISDGYLGFSGAAELYVNHLARQVAPYRLTGNYGGELLRGVRAFKSVEPKGEFLKAELHFRVQEAMKDFSRIGSVTPESFTLFVAGSGRIWPLCDRKVSGYGSVSFSR